MVKFSKELDARLIPEWRDAFVNYRHLKKIVKKIKLSRQQSILISHNHDSGVSSTSDPIRFLFSKLTHRNAASNKPEDVKNVIPEGEDDQQEEEKEEEDDDGDEDDEAQLVDHACSEEDEFKDFFEKLDEELNKVNQFYEAKENEFVERGEILSKQFKILLDLQQVVDERKRSRLNSSGQSSDSETPSELVESPREESQTDDANTINSVVGTTRRRIRTNNGNPNVKINVLPTTPTSTIISITSTLWENIMHKDGGEYINGKKLQYAEKMIREAFVELYKSIDLLNKYSSLNMVAFQKILKKFDKVTNQQRSEDYLGIVKRSHFISSDKVVRLMKEVESCFIEHFAKDDRKKAMKFLRPQQQPKDSHMLTFFLGLFTGIFIALFAIFAILAYITDYFSHRTDADYMENVYHVFSIFALLSLHLFVYGCNLFMWKRTRINYLFIFQFRPSTALKYRDAFLVCMCMMTLVVSAMILHLTLVTSGFRPSKVDCIPGILLLIFLAVLICPLNMFYRSTRFSFLRVLRNIICSPLYKVLMVDFFLADQLTSQIPLLRHMESTACHFLVRRFSTHPHQTCKSGTLYSDLVYIISFAPYFWRVMQCARRWFDEHDVNHLANLGKYASAVVAGGARLTYARLETPMWLMIVVPASSVATIYQLYWDYIKDWGLLDTKSKNLLLRDELVLKKRSIYYIAIALNFVLRFAWLETVLQFRGGLFRSRLLQFSFASLEIIRRGHWNYYRLENEHLNNVGKFRAVRAVPLPFRETDSDD